VRGVGKVRGEGEEEEDGGPSGEKEKGPGLVPGRGRDDTRNAEGVRRGCERESGWARSRWRVGQEHPGKGEEGDGGPRDEKERGPGLGGQRPGPRWRA
jgi:hypothetical protein